MQEDLDRETKYKNLSQDFLYYGKIFLLLILLLLGLSFFLDSGWFRSIFASVIVGGFIFLFGVLGLKHGVHISNPNISGQPNFSTGPFARKLNLYLIIGSLITAIIYFYLFNR